MSRRVDRATLYVPSLLSDALLAGISEGYEGDPQVLEGGRWGEGKKTISTPQGIFLGLWEVTDSLGLLTGPLRVFGVTLHTVVELQMHFNGRI